MSGSLAAGLSLAQAADAVTREGAEPVAGEFRRALVETRLGVPLEDALEGVAERFDSDDMRWTVMAIRIQREVGGNLAELLDTVAATMREREYVRRQVSTLTAEGRLSAWVLGSLPVLFLAFLLAFNREYVNLLFTDPRGLAMLAFGFVLLGAGVLWMSRLVRVEV
jgi:tight adherence protein B